jgi:hypothetical protein
MLNRRTFVSALALGTAATAVKPMAASAAINEASSLNRPFTRSEVLQTSPFYIERYVEEPGNVEFAQYTLKVVDPMGNAQFMIWGSAKPGNEAGAAYVFPGTSQENWKMIQEENGTAFVFSSKRPLELIVPFGTLDTEKGRLKAGDTINTMGAARPGRAGQQPAARRTAGRWSPRGHRPDELPAHRARGRPHGWQPGRVDEAPPIQRVGLPQ